jgi:transcription initiation factor TFIIIB Brf1 subunit/transcription initiation factor TFIIB
MLFELFDKFNSNPACIEESQPICKHAHLVTEYSSVLCKDCGIELRKDEPVHGWKSNPRYDNPNSCSQQTSEFYVKRYVKEKSIYSDVQNMNISEHIKDIANSIYTDVCQDKVHRGVRRKAIIFASVFHAYKLDDNPQSYETLIHIFDIQRKDALKGLKYINENISRQSPIRTVYITPEHLIREFLAYFSISEERKAEIIALYHQVKNKSSILNRSRPQSVASGIIWYWIKLNRNQLDMKEFTSRVDLSELTIVKMAKEVSRILGKEGIV